MLVISLILVSALGGVLSAALIAGGTVDRKKFLLLIIGAVFWSFLSGLIIFFMKDAVREIAVTQSEKFRHLPLLVPDFKIPDAVMFHLGAAVCLGCITLFLWNFNCRKNSTCWYYALLWSAGIIFLCGHILFLPLYSGLGTWLNLAGGFSPEVTASPVTM